MNLQLTTDDGTCPECGEKIDIKHHFHTTKLIEVVSAGTTSIFYCDNCGVRTVAKLTLKIKIVAEVTI